MVGAVLVTGSRTPTPALNHAALPHALEIVSKGWKKAMQQNPAIRLKSEI